MSETESPVGEDLVVIDDLHKRFGDREVLSGVSLTVREGETVAIIGPSGGGKSTLLRCINGLSSFDKGSVRVGPSVLRGKATEREALREAAQVRRLAGMVFQDFQLFPHRTALENITEAPIFVLGKAANEAREQGLSLLERVGLADRSGAYPSELSGGQKQRVAIARALAMGPRVLLCDEITSALDPELKGDVLRVLEDLKGDGLTLLMVTHEIGFARRAADRVAVLADGVVIEEGPSREVIERPSAARTQEFLRRVME